MRFKARRCATLEEVRAWVKSERQIAWTNTDRHGQPPTRPTAARSVPAGESPCRSVPPSAELVANAAFSLLNLCCHLLDRQLESQAAAFVEEGGFTERLYRVRSQRRNHPQSPRA